MRTTGAWLALAALAATSSLVVPALADLDFSRVHVVDVSPDKRNWIFRGNFPKVTVNGTGTFARAELTQYMQQRALQEAGTALPATFDLSVISFDNILEIADVAIEIEYFSNPAHGNFTMWPLIGALLPPQDLDNATRTAIVQNQTALWAIDQLPSRLAAVRSMILTPRPNPLVIYWHCEAGCDRTGEFSGAYYVTYENYNITGAFARDTLECGRAPNYFSQGALGWFCLSYEYVNGVNIGDCLNF